MVNQLEQALERKRAAAAARSLSLQLDSAAPAAPRAQAILLDARQAAVFLGVSLRTLYALRAAGKLPMPVLLGERTVRYRRADLIAYVEGLQASATLPEPAQLVKGKRAARAEEVAA